MLLMVYLGLEVSSCPPSCVSWPPRPHPPWAPLGPQAAGAGQLTCNGQDAKHSKQHIDLGYVQHCFLLSAVWFVALAAPLYYVYHEEPPRDGLKARAFSLSGA
jgi:hypothetical protein